MSGTIHPVSALGRAARLSLGPTQAEAKPTI